EHFVSLLMACDADALFPLHDAIKEQYLLRAPADLSAAGLQELAPLIEAVHHACMAGAREQALGIYRDRLEGEEMRLSYQLTAYDTVSRLMNDFFPMGNIAAEPDLSSGADRRYVLNRKAVALMNTGLLEEAVRLYDRAVSVGLEANDIVGAI